MADEKENENDDDWGKTVPVDKVAPDAERQAPLWEDQRKRPEESERGDSKKRERKS